MSTMYELQNEKKKYKKLKESLYVVANRLDEVQENLNNIALNISNNYSIDEISADKGQFNSLKIEIKKIETFLMNEVKNNIDWKINTINSKIENYNNNN